MTPVFGQLHKQFICSQDVLSYSDPEHACLSIYIGCQKPLYLLIKEFNPYLPKMVRQLHRNNLPQILRENRNHEH